MIDAVRLLDDLQGLRARLEDDLRERSEAVDTLAASLRAEWQEARAGERTAQAYEEWREEALTQAAVMWLLATVFVRFLEDNDLVGPPMLAGPGDSLQRARDEHTLYFRQHPHHSDRDYLYAAFEAVAALPGAGALFDRGHNPVWRFGISGDAAAEILAFWQRVDPDTGTVVHDFTDPAWGTRFLGDLYQDLSASARKRYALLQTPDFVLRFILDRTLTPALDEFGLQDVRLIDPACGSGHFLLEAFDRLFRLWQQREPGTNPRELAQRALAQVSGVDLNPFAVAIARFRLLLAALRASGITRLGDAPAFRFELAAGDSLLHGPRPHGELQMYLDPDHDPIGHVYSTEDAADLRRILGRKYHVVVGNPPYITVKDKALNDAYRARFDSCYRQYSVAVPFTERFFDLAIAPGADETTLAGHVGMITANSFMKREFGKRLIGTCIPRWDLTHVIDTSGAYIPGHGTPTVILFARNRTPASSRVRAVLGIRGEPSTPDDASKGLVWSAIVDQIDRPGSSSAFISVTDTPRDSFHRHPWSIGGGGAAEMKQLVEEQSPRRLDSSFEAIGRTTVVGEDDAWIVDEAFVRRMHVGPSVPLVVGECVRDWAVANPPLVIYPYSRLGGEAIILQRFPRTFQHLWGYRCLLSERTVFQKSLRDMGRPWYEHLEHYRDKLQTPLSITFAFVATHNHFVLDRGGKVFKQSAPVIKLKPEATEDDHLALLGLLNSSTGCFWMKQVCHSKGAQGINEGAKAEAWERFIEVAGTALESFPVSGPSTLPLAARLDRCAAELRGFLPSTAGDFDVLTERGRNWHLGHQRMVSLQEELDWDCYGLYGLVDDVAPLRHDAPPGIRLGERAFEIVMARRMAAGELQTAWFERHGSTPITELPSHWPDDYRRVVQQRVDTIEANPHIALIEQPEYKRRWNVEPWDEQVARALRQWLLDRLETPSYWPEVALTTTARLADVARRDADFMRVAAIYRGQESFDVAALVDELVKDEAVPFLPVLRYRVSGLRKREVWERTWALQRQEDAIDARVSLPEGDPHRLTPEDAAKRKQAEVGTIPVPPKYGSTDFLSSTFWRLRGKLDVPKERFISYPHCERDADPTLVVAWAGWDHLQQARALATYCVQMRESEGWPAARLTPLLAGLLELLPWLKQWHNDVDPEFGVGMGDYFEGFMDEQLRSAGLTRGDVVNWQPPAAGGRRTTRRQA